MATGNHMSVQPISSMLIVKLQIIVKKHIDETTRPVLFYMLQSLLNSGNKVRTRAIGIGGERVDAWDESKTVERSERNSRKSERRVQLGERVYFV